MAASSDPNVSLLLMIGGDAPDRVVRQGRGVRITGASDISKLLLPTDRYHRLHIHRNLLRAARRPELGNYRHLLNLITEAEQNSRSLEIMHKLTRDVPGKVINRPQAVLRSTRDQVARRLAGVPGLVVPEVVRLAAGKSAAVCERAFSDSGAAPPFILREAGTHGGRIVGCFESVETLLSARNPEVDHIATRFVDFKSADGLYRKYRVFVIGGKPILRHMLISERWNVHAHDRAGFMAARPELVAEERALFEEGAPLAPAVRQVLQGVGERMALDFFGIDFGITRDAEVVLFEANATMNFFPFSPEPQFDYLKRCFLPARQAFRDLLGLAPQPQGDAGLNPRLEPA